MKIKKFAESYIDAILLVVAVLFAGLIFWFFADSTSVISDNFSKAISLPVPSSENSKFNLEGAKKLDLRGLGS